MGINRRVRGAITAAASSLIIATAAGWAAGAASAAVTVQSISLWKSNAAPVAWTADPDRVYYNAVGVDGMYEGYSANPDGSGVTCLTCTSPAFSGVGATTQRGVMDVSRDGRYMLLEVESPNHVGAVGGADAEPGRGAFNDVWLATTDGSRMWPLTNVTAPGSGVIGTMWARFSPSGNQVVFDEMYAPAIDNLGYWKMVVANIVWNDGVPSLADETVIEPASGLFLEPYGFSPDGSKVIFASNLDQPSWMDSQIWESNTDGSDLTRLSPSDAPAGTFTDYNEFAFFTPSGSQIVYGRTVDSSAGGIDYWIMNSDGSDSQRLTFFNEPWSSESQGYTITGGLAFNPSDPDQFLASTASSIGAQEQNAVLITLSDPSSTGGLQASYYPGSTTFQGTPVTGVNNPSSGFFENSAAPAPGVGPTDYSIRWTGTVMPPVSGTYGFCVVVDDGADLYVSGHLVVADATNPGQRVCGSASANAGQPLPIELDYWHQQGTAYAQLTWTPPGDGAELSATDGSEPLDWTGTSAAGDVIPSSYLTPAAPGPLPDAQSSILPAATTAGAGPTQAPTAAGSGQTPSQPARRTTPRPRRRHRKAVTARAARAPRRRRATQSVRRVAHRSAGKSRA